MLREVSLCDVSSRKVSSHGTLYSCPIHGDEISGLVDLSITSDIRNSKAPDSGAEGVSSVEGV